MFFFLNRSLNIEDSRVLFSNASLEWNILMYEGLYTCVLTYTATFLVGNTYIQNISVIWISGYLFVWSWQRTCFLVEILLSKNSQGQQLQTKISLCKHTLRKLELQSSQNQSGILPAVQYHKLCILLDHEASSHFYFLEELVQW